MSATLGIPGVLISAAAADLSGVVLLAGRSGGQNVAGGVIAGETLTLRANAAEAAAVTLSNVGGAALRPNALLSVDLGTGPLAFGDAFVGAMFGPDDAGLLVRAGTAVTSPQPGKTVQIQGSDALGAGNNIGGNIEFLPGSPTGAGAHGEIVFDDGGVVYAVSPATPNFLDLGKVSSDWANVIGRIFRASNNNTVTLQTVRTTAGAGPTVAITAAAGLTAGAGGAVTITAGAGASLGGGTGGAVTITTGNGSSGSGGGALALVAGVGNTAGAGGPVSVTAGAGGSAAAGGGVTITAGAGGAAGGGFVGGAVSLLAGAGGSTAAGGAVTITAGAGGATGSGGAASLTAGNAGSGTGGAASLVAGTGGGAGGAAFVTAGAAGGGGGVGGAVTITAGLGTAAANAGGAVTLTAGNSGAAGIGAAITLAGGVGTTGAGGDIVLTPGAPTGGATAGVARVRVGTGTAFGRLASVLDSQPADVSVSPTAPGAVVKTYTLPANSLVADGAGIRVIVGCFTTGIVGTRQFLLRFGGVTIFDSGAFPVTVTPEPFWLTAMIYRNGAALESCISTWLPAVDGPINAYTQETFPALALSADRAVELVVTTVGAGSTIGARNWLVESVPI
jgi:hypothetical protein